MTLSDFSIKRPVFSWILMFGLIFFGLLSVKKMGINENPDIDFPTIEISYIYEGASPEVIEKDVIEIVESTLVTMQGVRNMTSNCNRNSGRISLEFEVNQNIDFAVQEVNTLVARAQRQLPEAVDPPTITKSNADDNPILILGLTSESLDKRGMMVLFRDKIRDRLTTVEGVSEVRAFGYHEPVLRVDLDAKKMQQYQLTPNDIIDSIQREHTELPAGKFEKEDKEDLIRFKGEAMNIQGFEGLPISRRGGSPNFVPLKLSQVSHIYEGLEPIRRISRINGVPALGIGIQKQRGVNAVATADRVIAKLKEIQPSLPEKTQLIVNMDMTEYVRASVSALFQTVIESILLTSIVCWLFIGSWSAAMNILLAIPTSIIGTFIFIQWMGFTLNSFTLLGLALAVGLVVDDAIVMMENIIRFTQKGMDKVNAAFKGAREITFAVIVTTIALISIFIPIVFMNSIEGRFFYKFAITLSVAVALSGLEALTLAPMRCSQYLEIAPRINGLGRAIENVINKIRGIYSSILAIGLRRPGKIFLASMALFFFSLYLIKFLPSELIPASDRGALFVIFKAPDGKSMAYTSEKVAEFEKLAMQHPAVERLFVAVGGFGEGGQGNRGNGSIILKDYRQRKQSQMEVAQELTDMAKKIEGLTTFVRDGGRNSLGGRRGNAIEFTISGPETEVREKIFRDLKAKVDQSQLISGFRSDDMDQLPEVQLLPDRQQAAASGVEMSEIARAVNVGFGGISATQYTSGGRRFDVAVQLREEDRQNKSDVANVLIRNNRGEFLPLGRVVNLNETLGPQTIFRENRQRGTRVDANLQPGAPLGNAIQQIKDWSSDILPDNYFIKFTATPQEKLQEFLTVILIGLLIAYMVLASQFNSFIDPWIVFLAIPFAITGAVIALIISQQSLNLFSAIAMLLTMGIVKKNSILLVEFTNQLRDHGLSIQEALKQACDTRLRPILMTNIATLAAAVPPALATGPGAEARKAMALTLIGGVLLSLIFTLIVVPCAYLWIHPKRRPILMESPD